MQRGVTRSLVEPSGRLGKASLPLRSIFSTSIFAALGLLAYLVLNGMALSARGGSLWTGYP